MTPAVVLRVIDGDTIVVRGGAHVRLVQIDAPETHFGTECWGVQATRVLQRLIPPGTRIVLATDPRLDTVDRYHRLLRYIFRSRDHLDVNVELVREGAAAPYFYDGDLGRYWQLLKNVALRARAAHRGLWGACGRVPVDFFRGVDTGRVRR